MQKQIYDACQEGGAVVTVKIDTIKTKQFRALHLWFDQCDAIMISIKQPYHKGMSGKKRNWRKDDFKHGVFKPFLREYKGLDSTKKQGTNTLNECFHAISGHIVTEYGVTLPPFPSVESLSMAALLRL